MKKLISLLLFSIIAFTSYAQNKVDFLDFARSFDWNQSEADFKIKYKDRIVLKTDSIPDVHAATGNWLLKDLYIGEYEIMAFVRYNAGPQKIAMGGFLAKDLLDNGLKTCEDIVEIVQHRFGKPDISLEDVSLASFNLEDMGIEKGDLKMWLSDAPVFMTIVAGNEEQKIICIGAVPGLDRDPDFRHGFWGDSLADVKKKEGKADEFNMNGVYAFTTYVAGLECLAAYRFTGNKLTSGKYVFLNNNSDNCIRNYEKLVNLLTKKYGEPANKDRQNSAESYEQRIYTEGELVRKGKMKFETYWFTPFSTIAIFLNGEQYSVSLNIEYYSNKLEEEREKEVLKDL